MNLLHMRGSWGRAEAWLYATVVAKGVPPLYERFVEQAPVPLATGGRIVDVGCGDGQLARLLAERFDDGSVLGLDLSPVMVRRAQERAGEHANLEFRVGDAMSLPLDDDSVDLAVSVASIKHWPDPARGVAELGRVLRPGAAFCILEADPECSLSAARSFVAHWRYVLPGTRELAMRYFVHFVARQAPRVEQVEGFCQAAGLVEVEAERREDLPFYVVQARAPREAA